jgi:hypothetical protein
LTALYHAPKSDKEAKICIYAQKAAVGEEWNVVLEGPERLGAPSAAADAPNGSLPKTRQRIGAHPAAAVAAIAVMTECQ